MVCVSCLSLLLRPLFLFILVAPLSLSWTQHYPQRNNSLNILVYDSVKGRDTLSSFLWISLWKLVWHCIFFMKRESLKILHSIMWTHCAACHQRLNSIRYTRGNLLLIILLLLRFSQSQICCFDWHSLSVFAYKYFCVWFSLFAYS